MRKPLWGLFQFKIRIIETQAKTLRHKQSLFCGCQHWLCTTQRSLLRKTEGKPQRNSSSLNILSSSSSSGGGRAEGISWISRRVSSVDWRFPSWCSCWLTQEAVKPPSSWEGVGEATALKTKKDRREKTVQMYCLKGTTRHKLTFLGLRGRCCRACRVPVWPVRVCNVDEPHHRGCETVFIILSSSIRT